MGGTTLNLCCSQDLHERRSLRGKALFLKPRCVGKLPFPHFFGMFLLVVLFALKAQTAAAQKIDFEESIPQPDTVTSQYCVNPSINQGVKFLGKGGRIFVPSVQTASPTHALTNQFPSGEFDEFETLKISFSTGQSSVSVKVGLNKSHSFQVTAVIYAYSTETPGSGYINYGTAYIGNGPSAIDKSLSVSSSAGDIRSVEIEFSGPSTGNAAHELIDDLTFTAAGPACAPDTTSPSVQITTPATDGSVTYVPQEDLAFTAKDNESGVAKIQVSFLDASDTELESFYVCGGPGVPTCLYDVTPTQASYNFQTFLADGTRAIRVKAWDFADHTGQAKRTINYTSPGPNLNMWAKGMEITQVTQPWVAESASSRSNFVSQVPVSTNSVSFVAGKRTVVRVYPGIEGTNVVLKGCVASLSCTDSSGIPCSGPTSIQPKSAITVDPADNNSISTFRQNKDKSWNFTLPQAWTEQNKPVNLIASVNAPPGVQECTGCIDGANSLEVSGVDFQDTAALDLHLVWACVRRDSKDTISNCDHAPFTIYQDVFEKTTHRFVKTYPVSLKDIDISFHSPQWVPIDGDFNHPSGAMTSTRMSAWHNQVGALLDAATGKKRADNPINLVYFGIVPPPVTLIIGLGNRNVAIGKLDSANLLGDDLAVAAHEIGHSLGRPHASCDHGEGGCEAAPTVFPCTHGGICTYGFDTYKLEVVSPGNPPSAGHAHDLMSYGPEPLWISPYTYEHLFDTLHDALNATGAWAPMPNNADMEEVLWVSGTLIVEEGTVRSADFLPFYHLTGNGASTETSEGICTLELRDADGMVLASRSFNPRFVEVDPPDPEFNPPLRFFEVLPFDPRTARVVLRQGQTVLEERVRTANAPAVLIISIDPGETWGNGEFHNLIWESSDADPEDVLYHLVQYSTDGGSTWSTLVTDWPGTSLEVDASVLAGSNTARFRVFATDGVNTAIAESPVFMVENKPPLVAVVSPDGESGLPSYDAGEVVVLEGTGTDLEDGALPEENLSWDSHKDGAIGSGRRLDISSLSEGTHEITLVGTDSNGRTGTDAISIKIVKQLNVQPLADAGPDRLAAPGVSIQLDAGGSLDVNGDPLSYLWSVVSGPEGAVAQLSSPGEVQTGFIADQEGDYLVELVVHDGIVGSTPDRAVVRVTGAVSALPDGIWKDAPFQAAAAMSFYVQTYETGSILIIASPDGVNAYAFLDDDLSDGVNIEDLGGLGYHLTANFPSAGEGTAVMTLPTGGTVEYTLHPWFPASPEDAESGIWKDEIPGGTETMSFFVQAYQDAVIVIASPDARSFIVFLDPDKTDGVDAYSMAGDSRFACRFETSVQANGGLETEWGGVTNYVLHRWFSAPYLAGE